MIAKRLAWYIDECKKSEGDINISKVLRNLKQTSVILCEILDIFFTLHDQVIWWSVPFCHKILPLTTKDAAGF